MDNEFNYLNNQPIDAQPSAQTGNSGYSSGTENYTGDYNSYAQPADNSAYVQQPYSTPYNYNAGNGTESFGSIPTQTQPQVNAYQNVPYQYTPSDFSTPKKKKKGKKVLAAAAVFCALIVAVGGAYRMGREAVPVNASVGTADSNSGIVNANDVVNITSSGEVTSSITQVVEDAMPSMVCISTVMTTSMGSGYDALFGYLFGEEFNTTYETSASGSGIIIGQTDEELLIATNNHVVEDSSEIMAEFIDGEAYAAKVKGTAPDNDLAVISVNISDISAETLGKIKVAVLGDSNNLKLGEPAIAIGNSLGYGQSVTVGYISATERQVQLTDKMMSLIQTDAAINPGNSGGALLNIKGEVIGINSAKYSDTSVEGTGYAIPITDAEPIINSLINSTYVSEDDAPYLGIYGTDVPASYQESLNWPSGAYVSQVTQGSPAALAGLEKGDIITNFNGTEVSTMTELQEAIAKCHVGDKVSMQVTRPDGKHLKTATLNATLASRGDAK